MVPSKVCASQLSKIVSVDPSILHDLGYSFKILKQRVILVSNNLKLHICNLFIHKQTGNYW